jgi:hypothetical protein
MCYVTIFASSDTPTFNTLSMQHISVKENLARALQSFNFALCYCHVIFNRVENIKLNLHVLSPFHKTFVKNCICDPRFSKADNFKYLHYIKNIGTYFWHIGRFNVYIGDSYLGFRCTNLNM